MHDGRKAGGFPSTNPSRLDFIELTIARTDRAILISDAEGRPCYLNPAFETLFGYGLDDFAGRAPWSLLAGPMSDERLHRLARSRDADGAAFYDDLLLHTRAGDPVWVSAKLDPVHDGQGRFTHLVAMLSDITQSKRLQVLQRDLLNALGRDMPLAEFMEHICEQVQALAPDTICSILRVDENQRLRPLAAPSLPNAVAENIDGIAIGPRAGSCGTAAWRGEPVVVEDIQTDPLWADFKHLVLPLGLRACWSYPMVLRNGRVAGTFAFYFPERRPPSAWHLRLVETCLNLCVMAIERHEARTQIRRLAYYDTLTGLPNRVLMRQRVEQTLAGDPQRKKSLACLWLDLDRFKDINEAYGLPVGDMLLEAVSQRLLDRASSSDMVARMSADAFIMLLDDCRAGEAAAAAQGLLASLKEPFEVSGTAISLSGTIGIALYPGDATDVEMLLNNCETAMFEAKAAGRANYHFFSPEMNVANRDRLELGAALREALAGGQLSLAFQPQIDRNSEGLYGVEALARWTHPRLGPVGPDRFIPVAEQIGMIEDIGLWALRAACAQLAQWRAAGRNVPTISVNISAKQFRDGAFCQQVGETLAAYGLEPSDLTIEITESLMLDQTSAVSANTDTLSEMGVNLSMDDFGTGYSSLSLIARLPVNELKIDRAFIDRLESDAGAQAVATAVICIGQSLNMRVVAEGVETDAQRRFLDALGCDAQQGYLYSRPLTAQAMDEWFDARAGRSGASRRRA
ncbi:EAL domain-containing protein [Pelagibacterium halotolerans]|uniref:Diguanylate cyclase/phosphodiesterase (GGDEF & EAL domains) with PAS/PAC sensor(S) n=1 Tax=Pelagibacterium halotolerans (strain DSM 22347 / JCM 15775 / CGMCC 1.7692 / B2) TaxID=1082931 RepID=G4RA10_PELHB|nr:EAL domain-containing protein [Pelagibacterium halotolerans]AEQ52537.1 diguanylate cyclase/phosphodiesterase (GGDEF & EAL domains) with PAS/PAC sensor(s) [Pelagibacterium halotolerans B2]QJR17743.1 EAL domain-containing protein [Pelagibacterium halotolerans]SEA39431.1 diguanylate cyclase/phosphodiesterase with PAS/PAC sensor(s) [Pelagibacterium halotolerans]